MQLADAKRGVLIDPISFEAVAAALAEEASSNQPLRRSGRSSWCESTGGASRLPNFIPEVFAAAETFVPHCLTPSFITEPVWRKQIDSANLSVTERLR